MIEYIVIAVLVWVLIGAIRFIANLEQFNFGFEFSGADRVIMLPFALVLWIIGKFKS